MLPSIKRRVDWSVAPQANPGDLILFYHAKPEMCIRSIFRVDSRVQKDRNAAWKHGTKLKSKEDFWSYVKPVLHLKTPIHLSELRQHPVLAHTGHLRRQLIGRWRATPHWPVLFQMILDRNPAAKRTLAKFGPNRIV
jgi:predicted RNA-binding protein with PUA-like domain